MNPTFKHQRYILSLSVCLLLTFRAGLPAAYAQEDAEVNIRNNSFGSAIRFYQQYISPVRVSHCQMVPSCSEYGLQAFQQQHPVPALLNTSDRLLRCSHDYRAYQKTFCQGELRLYDPVTPDPIRDRKFLERHNSVVLFHNTDTLPEIKFINRLIARRNYREALLEMNRLMYFSDQVQAPEFYANYLACKRGVDEAEEGLYAWENDFPEEIKEVPVVLLETGNLYLKLYRYDEAILRYENCQHGEADSLLIDKSNLLIGLSQAYQDKWIDSRNAFLDVRENSLYKPYRQKCLEILDSREQFRYKKPWLAGSLAIVPGMGYLYAGHVQTAISSLVINGLLMYACYGSVKNKNYGLSALLGIVSLSFYIGNITGSVKSAQRYNTKYNSDIMRRLESTIYY